MENIAQQIATYLLEIEAVKIRPQQPFQWASGWLSPIYCDNRLTLSHPKIRSVIKNQFVHLIKEQFPEVNGIAGVATAGIPQSALVADQMDLPLLYVRSKPKGHGMENLIEGNMPKGSKLVVIEDLISTGGSSIKAALALQESGFEVLGLGAIFTYGFPLAQKNFEEANIPFFTLSDYSTLLEVALKENKIAESELASLEAWKDAPESWGN